MATFSHRRLNSVSANNLILQVGPEIGPCRQFVGQISCHQCNLKKESHISSLALSIDINIISISEPWLDFGDHG